MDQSLVSFTLPITPQGLNVIATAVAIAAASGIVVLMLGATEQRQENLLARWLRALGFVMVPIWVVIFAGVLWQLWALFSAAPGTQGTVAPSLGAGALIAAMLGAPFVIWATYLKQRTVDFQKEGHIADRITKAVEQLGAEKTVKKDGVESTEPNIEVRIGAIYSLERIAQDSTRYDKGRDHVRIMEILCAYIRENSKAREPVDYPEPEWKEDWDFDFDSLSAEDWAQREALRKERFEDSSFEGSKAITWAKTLAPPREDIAIAIRVLGRRTSDQRKVEAAWPNPVSQASVWPFDLDQPKPPHDMAAGAGRIWTPEETEDYSKALNIWNERLENYPGYRLDLEGANLQAANFLSQFNDGRDAVFAGANLKGARLEGANLINTRLEGAILSQAWLIGADLDQAELTCAMIERAQMEGADLNFARMRGVNLLLASLEGARLRYSDLQVASISWTHMEGASLDQAGLEGCELHHATFVGVSFFGARFGTADLSSAKIHKAFLNDTDLSNVTVTQDQINQTKGGRNVILPEGITRPAHWRD